MTCVFHNMTHFSVSLWNPCLGKKQAHGDLALYWCGFCLRSTLLLFTLHYSTDFLQCFHNSVPKVDVSTTFAFVCLQVSLNQPLILCKVLNVLWQVLCWGKFRMVVKKCLDPKNCVISFIFSHAVYVVCVMILRLTTPRSPANNAVPLSRPWAHWTWSFKWQLCTAHEPPFLQAWFPSYPTHLLWLPRSKAN